MQTITTQVLLIGDQHECAAIAAAIPRTLDGLRRGGEEAALAIETQELILHRSWEVDFGQGHWHLCIFFLSSHDAHLFIGNNKLLQDRADGILFITEDQHRLPANWILRHGRDIIFSRPFTDSMLAASIERLLMRIHERPVSDISDAEILRFTRHLLAEDTPEAVLEPVSLPNTHHGFGYPTLASFFGLNANDSAILEHMAGLGLVSKRIANRIRHCPACGASQLNYRQQCPRCSSLDFQHETIIHHFACGHMGTVQEFYRQGDLVCPKCHKRLRQIGVDYEKPATNHRCNDCQHLFAEPAVVAQCQHCGAVNPPAATRESTLFAYRLQPFAEQAVAAHSIHALDLGALLGSHTSGLASRQLFIYELNRDIQRFKRYQTPSSVVLVRVNNMEDIQRDLDAEFGDYVQMLFAAISSSLRSLDVTCIWDHNLLAVLLPGTPLEGAWVVARRMEEQAQAIRLPFRVDGPRISTSAETVRDDISSYQEILDHALGIHDIIADISDHDFMPD